MSNGSYRLFTGVLAVAALFAGRAPATMSEICHPGFERLAAILSAREAAREIAARRLAEQGVNEELANLRRNPAYHGRSEAFLRDIARSKIRAGLQSRDAEAAFDRAVARVEGRRAFDRQLEIFNHPERELDPRDSSKDTTELEDRLLSEAAFKFLTQKGDHTANASHIADHLAALASPDIAGELRALGIEERVVVRNALLHDLGKEYDQLPSELRAFLESIFPPPKAAEPDKLFLQRVILSHEFGSMMMTEKLAREAGIGEKKIPRLSALFAHHNAGYDPSLPGFHFWVQPFAWKSFGDAMRTHGVAVPEVYGAVAGTRHGGRIETIVLTAIDRATSLTLASQEKFAPVLVSQGKWNNEGLAGQFQGNTQSVMAEVTNVLGKLEPGSEAERRRFESLSSAITRFYEPDLARLRRLADALPKMGKGEGAFTDRPPTSADELSRSVLYRTEKDSSVAKRGTWFRVSADGKIYEGDGSGWVPRPDLSTPEGRKPDIPGLLFRKIVFPDQGYQPRVLERPAVMR